MRFAISNRCLAAAWTLAVAVAVLIPAGTLAAADRPTLSPVPILLDGSGAEHPALVDDAADGGLLTVQAAAYADGLWLGLEFDAAVAADSGSGLVLHIDTDADPATGDADGCDLVFDLQSRNGSLHPRRTLPGEGRLFSRLGIKVAPTFESTSCEILIPRKIRGGESIFTGERLRFFVVYAGDRAPDAGFVGLPWTEHAAPVQRIALARAPGSALRIASWNIKRDGLFEEDSADAIARLLPVIDADVLVVCESFRYDADEVLERVREISDSTGFMYARKADPGNVVLSRYPIPQWWSILDLPSRYNGHRGSAVLIDAPAGPIMVLPQHWRCCDKDGQRLYEADALIGFLRDAFTEGGNFTLPRELPFVICGDLNLVTTRRPLDVVLTGEVVDKDSYGPDFAPGPGRTPLVAVPLRHSDAPLMHTWRQAESKYYPGRLDWVLVPSNVEVLRGFVLDTGTMFGQTLNEHGLDRRDSSVASDHGAIVVDVTWDGADQ